MSKRNEDGLKECYVSGYKVTFSEPTNAEGADIPARAMFYGEIGEKEKNGNNPRYTENALGEEISDRIPADFIVDNNTGSEA